MIVKIGRRGKSFKGASLYYLHDKRLPGEKERLTAERVVWAETLNLANDDPQLAWGEMWRTAADQKELKRAAGVRTGGNRVHSPALPIVLSWAQPDRPTPEQQRTAALQFLHKMGWDSHQALLIAHEDTKNQHVHILLNRVNPDNGKVLEESYSHRHAQAWALQYQREHGQTWCPQREINARARAEGRPTQDNSQPYPLAKDAEAAHEPALAAEQDLATQARLEKDLLSRHQQEEREAFLAEGLNQIRGIRTAVFLEVRTEFKPQWRALHAAERGAHGNPEKLLQLSEARRELWDDVRSTTRERQDDAVKEFIGERTEQFQELKDHQRDDRAELRALIEAREAGTPIDEERLALLTGDRRDPVTHTQEALQGLRTANDNPQPQTRDFSAFSEIREAADAAPAADKPPRRDVGDAVAGGIGAVAEKIADMLSELISPPTPRHMAINRLIAERAEAARPDEEAERIARRVEAMRREDQQRRGREQDGYARERVHDPEREKDR